MAAQQVQGPEAGMSAACARGRCGRWEGGLETRSERWDLMGREKDFREEPGGVTSFHQCWYQPSLTAYTGLLASLCMRGN